MHWRPPPLQGTPSPFPDAKVLAFGCHDTAGPHRLPPSLGAGYIAYGSEVHWQRISKACAIICVSWLPC
jgi:hypothetical protein